jgi:hypothetical protein
MSWPNRAAAKYKVTMVNDSQSIWLAAGVRSPFVGVDGPVAHRDSLTLSMPVVQAMEERANGPINFGVWGAVIPKLAYAKILCAKRPASSTLSGASHAIG